MVMYEFQYKITKYNPHHYDQSEWTSISDVGKNIGGKILTLAEYQRVENLYLKAIKIAIHATHVRHLTIRGLEIHRHSNKILHENRLVSVDETIELCQHMLREGEIWCRLEADNQLFIHIGHDFYLYMGASVKLAPLWMSLANQGLFIEPN